MYPLFEVTPAEQFGITMNAFGLSQDMVGSFDPLFMNIGIAAIAMGK
jgi:hypothetical protein